MKSSPQCVVLSLCLLIPSMALGQEGRQLYRSFERLQPFKGYLLGPLTGATHTENFETCAGKRIFVDVARLEKQPGQCGDSNPSVGPLEVNVGELLGKNVYSTWEKVPLGTISDVTLSAGGDVKDIIVSGPAATGEQKFYTVDWNSVDVQPVPDGGVQVLIRATKDEIENRM